MSQRLRLGWMAVASAAVLLTTSAVAAQDRAGADVTVAGIEYAFEGLPTSVPAGTTFGFQNNGTEMHQFLVVQKNEGVTETWEELMALPEEEANSKVTFIGDLIAGPGSSSPDTFSIDKEGAYFAVCFIPQGAAHDPTVSFDPMDAPDPSAAVPSGEPIGGIPHAFLGMTQEFTVTAADSTPGPLPAA